jgi:hypothetical protein
MTNQAHNPLLLAARNLSRTFDIEATVPTPAAAPANLPRRIARRLHTASRMNRPIKGKGRPNVTSWDIFSPATRSRILGGNNPIPNRTNPDHCVPAPPPALSPPPALPFRLELDGPDGGFTTIRLGKVLSLSELSATCFPLAILVNRLRAEDLCETLLPREGNVGRAVASDELAL